MKKLLVFLLLLMPALGQTSLSASPTVDYVLVIKAERKIFLMQGGVPVKEYPISLGLRPVGHKVFEGDMRTPEGLYVLDWRNANSNFYKSIHISYPSPDDVARAMAIGKSPGGMIMIHGLPSNKKNIDERLLMDSDWTEGCIAVSNQAMDEIWSSVTDGTPIVILP